MFEKEIILKEQLAARCLFQCSPARKLPANAGTFGYLRFAHYPRISAIDLYKATFQYKWEIACCGYWRLSTLTAIQYDRIR
jgi:hypothetical protein